MFIGFFYELSKPHLAASFSEVPPNLKFSAALVITPIIMSLQVPSLLYQDGVGPSLCHYMLATTTSLVSREVVVDGHLLPTNIYY